MRSVIVTIHVHGGEEKHIYEFSPNAQITIYKELIHVYETIKKNIENFESAKYVYSAINKNSDDVIEITKRRDIWEN